MADSTAQPAVELPIHNPATGDRVGAVPIASAADVERAVARARHAQSAWEALGAGHRAKLLTRFHDLLFDRQEEVLDCVQRETGKTRREALGELLIVAGTARYYATRGPGYLADESHPGAAPVITGAKVVYRPHGVVGFITPWNYPFILSIADALPALLAGNTVVIKPSEVTPLSAELGVQLLILSGFDEEVVQLVHGGGEVGTALVDQADYIGFTGSAATGRKIAVRASERLIPHSLELGGKNPMIVTDSAPLEDAVTGLLNGAFYNTGQTCIAIERAYIERSIFDDFVAQATERTAALRLGWSLDWEMDMGSLISSDHADKVAAHVDDAIAKGARLLTGGTRRPDLGEAFFEPTLLTGVDSSMALCGDETFGPVVALYPFDDVDDAVASANDTPYGLNASVWSGSDAESEAIARRIDAGSVGINATLLIYNTFDVPMGGVKQSGGGRRHGRPGILRFTRSHSIFSSVSRGGGYENVLTKITTPGRASALAKAFKLMRRIPGLR